MKTEIPVMFCFDNNYVIPAAVAFYSLLEHASRRYFYKFYVLHSDITLDNRQKLYQTIEGFSSFSSLEFIDMSHRFDELWEKIQTKGHFSKEVMYKVLVASIFPQYEKLIVSDVDVVFLGDISKSYIEFNTKDDYYLAGVKVVGKIEHYMDNYRNKFSEEEITKLSQFCGGYIVFNLEKLRKDNMENKFIECFERDGYRINQMEQDVLNLCCYPATKKLPLNYVTCSYMWDLYATDDDFKLDFNYTEQELRDAMAHPIQLHYATSIKPWKNVECTKSEEWFKCLVKTPFLREYLESLPQKIVIPSEDELITSRKDRILSLAKRTLFYVKKNPLFLFNLRFYKKLYRKVSYRIFKKKNNDISLLILDDTFPSKKSPFRYQEFLIYLNNIYNSQAILTKGIKSEQKRDLELDKIVEHFVQINPEMRNRVKTTFIKGTPVSLAITAFLNNIYANLSFLEKNKIPFVFTLYPGGGFSLNDKESDKKLTKVLSSPFFRKVIVTQKMIFDYLIDRKLCAPDKIQFIYGGVINDTMFHNRSVHREYFGYKKETLNICFVAHKYSEKGIDKGYDIFIEVAKILAEKYPNIMFNIVGDFTENDIDVSKIKDRINFHGVRETEWLKAFYQDQDIIIAPNKPFVLSKGSFDGFPTLCGIEAMLNKVALFCTDELKANIKFKDGEDLVIIKHDTNDIVKKIEYYYNHPKELTSLAKQGYKSAKKYYSFNKQLSPRLSLIERLIKKEKNKEK